MKKSNYLPFHMEFSTFRESIITKIIHGVAEGMVCPEQSCKPLYIASIKYQFDLVSDIHPHVIVFYVFVTVAYLHSKMYRALAQKSILIIPIVIKPSQFLQ